MFLLPAIAISVDENVIIKHKKDISLYVIQAKKIVV